MNPIVYRANAYENENEGGCYVNKVIVCTCWWRAYLAAPAAPPEAAARPDWPAGAAEAAEEPAAAPDLRLNPRSKLAKAWETLLSRMLTWLAAFRKAPVQRLSLTLSEAPWNR